MFHKIRWTAQKIEQRLSLIEALVYRRTQLLSPFRFVRLDGPSLDAPVSPDVDDGDWESIPWGGYWGAPDTNFCLRTRFQIPADWDGDVPVALFLPIGEAGDFSHPEALAYIDGQPFAGCDRHHQEIILDPRWCDGRPHLLALHGWTGGTHDLRFGLSGASEEKRRTWLLMSPCQVVEIHQPTRDLIALTRVALGVAVLLGDNVPARAHLYNALDAAFKVLDTREPFDDRFYDSVPVAHQVLVEGVGRAGAPLDVDITAVGHAHIDLAWLWTLDQSRRKGGRTFYTVQRLMEQFPEYRFAQSQPQLYDWVRQDHPALFEAIGERVQEGRWDALGGMWVEADCNLSGGESLARQFLLGLEFYRRHYGRQAESPVLWLPDVFGYAWNLPQLIKEAGLAYFFTIKIGWSQYNRFPYDSFWWQGLDGTRILTHFSPTMASGSDFASTYNGAVLPDEVMSTWSNFQQKDWGRPGSTPPLMMAFGHGDGGGGPTREMLENARVLQNFPAMPRVRIGTVGEFFEKLEAEAGDRLPTWNGELYLEYHRGTYTSQARSKRANRKSEFLLHDAEFLATLAATLDPDYAYPYARLGEAWRLVCLNQFHDIIPGSSIGEVYAESLAQYDTVRDLGVTVRREALASIGGRVGGGLVVVNPTGFSRQDLAFWPDVDSSFVPRRPDGTLLRTQVVDGGLLLDAGELPPYSTTPLEVEAAGTRQAAGQRTVHASPALLENDLLRVEFDGAGHIRRIYDKVHDRDVLPPGGVANQFQVFEDRPKTPDAWEIDIYYDDKVWLSEPVGQVKVVETGPLRGALEVRRRVFSSEIVQRISLAHNSPRLDFDTTVQWRERHAMLKVAFPVDVLSPVATYEIQWGNVQRPTHRNTSWDWARFETCAQKWVDLSEGDYGVSLLNDCKYGHDIRDNVMRLTLLRGPTDPDPNADLGEHRFTYSLLPHGGSWDEFTVSQAYALNDPLLVWDNPNRQVVESLAVTPFVEVDLVSVVIETVKQAEDGEGIVVRLYESQRRRGDYVLTAAFPLAEAWRTDLLEENRERLEVEGCQVRGTIKPYQILTLRLVPNPKGFPKPLGFRASQESPTGSGSASQESVI